MLPKGVILLYYEHQVMFYYFSFAAVVIFGLGIYKIISLLRLGKKPSLHQPISKRLFPKVILSEVLFQTQLFKQSRVRWFMHITIYWGFTALFIQTALMMVLHYFVPEDSLISIFFYKSWGKHLLDFWGDFWGLVFCAGLILALGRRYVFRSDQLYTVEEDAVALWFLLAVAFTGFIAEGVRISLAGVTGADYSFIGVLLAKINNSFLGIRDKMFMFWIHGIIGLALIAYLPFSKLLHIFTAPIEIVLSSSQEIERGEQYSGFSCKTGGISHTN